MAGYNPLQSVVYLVVMREQNSRIFAEFLHSLASLRRFHPEVPVLVYHQNLPLDSLNRLRRLPQVMEFPIAVDDTGRFEENRYLERYGWIFPELRVLAAKIDVLLLTPGDTLLIDTDTEVLAPLDEVFARRLPRLLESEGSMAAHERDFRHLLGAIQWPALGWRGDLERLELYNSGAVHVPQELKPELYKAKELLWVLAQLPGRERGDNRLDEQIALSIALQEATNYDLPQIAPRIYHFWREKYERRGEWYARIHGSAAGAPAP